MMRGVVDVVDEVGDIFLVVVRGVVDSEEPSRVRFRHAHFVEEESHVHQEVVSAANSESVAVALSYQSGELQRLLRRVWRGEGCGGGVGIFWGIRDRLSDFDGGRGRGGSRSGGSGVEGVV